MRYGIDLDDTAITGDLILEASMLLLKDRLIDKIYTGKDVTSYELSGIPKIVKEKTIELFSIPLYAVWKKRPIQGTESFLELLRLRHHEVFIITARPIICHEETKDYVEKTFFIPRNNIFCVGTNSENTFTTSKASVLSSLDLNYYMDDNIAHCKEAVKLDIDTYLITNSYTPWNHNYIDKRIKKLKNICFFPYKYI